MVDGDIEKTFKLLLIGNSGIGKSSLMLRFTTEQFQHARTTVGVDFKIKLYEYEGRTYKLLIWDTAGQERFRTLTSSYYRGAHGVMVVYDVSDVESFRRLGLWMQELERYHPAWIPKVLIGNKLDKEEERQVSQADGEAFANANSMTFVECSAKTNTHVQDAFRTLVAEMVEASKRQPTTTYGGHNTQPGISLSQSAPRLYSITGCLC